MERKVFIPEPLIIGSVCMCRILIIKNHLLIAENMDIRVMAESNGLALK